MAENWAEGQGGAPRSTALLTRPDLARVPGEVVRVVRFHPEGFHPTSVHFALTLHDGQTIGFDRLADAERVASDYGLDPILSFAHSGPVTTKSLPHRPSDDGASCVVCHRPIAWVNDEGGYWISTTGPKSSVCRVDARLAVTTRHVDSITPKGTPPMTTTHHIDPASMTDRERKVAVVNEQTAKKRALREGKPVPATPVTDWITSTDADVRKASAKRAASNRGGRKSFLTDQPKVTGAHVVPVKSAKHAEVVKHALGRGLTAKVDGSWLIVPNGEAQEVVNRLAAWATANRESVYDARLASASVVQVRHAFPKVTDSKPGASTKLVDALIERGIAWNVSVELDGSLRFAIDQGKGEVVGRVRDIADRIGLTLAEPKKAAAKKAPAKKAAAATKQVTPIPKKSTRARKAS